MDTPSSSSSSDNSCQICAQPAHGKHFGAISCRPCSAFFKRAVTGTYKLTKCRKMNGKCEAESNGRFNCKKCRLQKCYDAGMTPKKFQFDRDAISSTENASKNQKTIKKIPRTPENFFGRPSFIFSIDPDLVTSNKTLIDVQFLIDQAAMLFISETGSRQIDELSGLSTLDRLSYALALTRVPSTEKPVMCTKIGKDEKLIYWEHKFLTTANWLTYCDQFQRLDQSIKIEFLKSIWYVWMKIEKIGKSADKRMKNGKIDNNIRHILGNIYIDTNNVEIDTTWMSNYSREQIKYFLKKPSQFYDEHIVAPLIEIQASPQEITYLICVISFHYAAKMNRGKLGDLSEQLIDTLANDLHNYYLVEMKLRNYASRMAKLLKIVQFVENDIYERKQRAEIAKVLDIFTIEFSHPEMFIEI